MTTAAIAKVDSKIPVHADTILRRLDEFPELAQALRDGDVLTGRLFCAQLFNLDLRRDHVDEVAPALQATMKAL